MTTSTRHRWGPKERFGFYKSEQTCTRCDLVKVSRHEHEGGRDVHWKEYWRDQELISRDALPACDARLERELADNLVEAA